MSGRRADLPFAEAELLGDPTVLGYYYTQQEFIVRTALAVFPSRPLGTSEIVAGSFCEWRNPDVARLRSLPARLLLAAKRPRSEVRRLRYFIGAKNLGIFPEEIFDEDEDRIAMEEYCVENAWPSAVLTLQTVENDTPEAPKPELATIYFPLITTADVALKSLQYHTFNVQE